MTAAVAERMLSCRACGRRLPPEGFYPDGSRGTGRSARCRPCEVARLRARLVGEPGSPTRRRANARAEERRQERERRDPGFALKRNARRAARGARYAGAIHRPDACEICAARGVPLEGHHPDHRDPFRIIFVCRPDHERLPHRRAECGEKGAA